MSGSGAALNRQALLELLVELDQELVAEGQDATVFVVGGAAMALAYDDTRSTRDFDAAFDSSYQNAEGFLRMTSRIGDRHDLDEDWLNDGAKGMMPGDDEDAGLVYEGQALDVYVASVQYLLAMKLYAARPGRDLDDAVKLWSIAGYTSEDQGVELLGEKYPAQLLLPKHRYVIQDVAARAAEEQRANADPRPRTASDDLTGYQQQNLFGGPGAGTDGSLGPGL